MKKALLSILGVTLLLIIGYSYGIFYYSDKFQANTKIGKLDISNLTVAQAEQKVENNLKDKMIAITEKGKELGKIDVSDIKPKVKASEQLIEAYQAQDPNLWITKYFDGDSLESKGMFEVEVDQTNFNQKLLEANVNNSNRIPTKDAFIDFKDEYKLVEAKMGTQVDLDLLQSNMVSAIQDGQESLDLKESYTQPTIFADDEELQAMMAKIVDASDTKITLNIAGNKEVIPKKDIQKWLHFDDNNQPVYDEAMIYDYLKKYNDKYASYVNDRKFQSTLQGEVTVQPGTLGWSINREAEASQLAQDLKAGKDIERDPIIAGTGYDAGGDDIGDTYVEVDLANQHMFIYRDDKKVFDTAIVSGGPQSSTIPGAYAVWDKQQNAVLRGFNTVKGKEYASPVGYWMPFDTIGQGLHDADWQPSFGGDAYLYRGSLGCINISPSVMGEVFNLVDIGTPVIIF